MLQGTREPLPRCPSACLTCVPSLSAAQCTQSVKAVLPACGARSARPCLGTHSNRRQLACLRAGMRACPIHCMVVSTPLRPACRVLSRAHRCIMCPADGVVSSAPTEEAPARFAPPATSPTTNNASALGTGDDLQPPTSVAAAACSSGPGTSSTAAVPSVPPASLAAAAAVASARAAAEQAMGDYAALSAAHAIQTAHAAHATHAAIARSHAPAHRSAGGDAHGAMDADGSGQAASLPAGSLSREDLTQQVRVRSARRVRHWLKHVWLSRARPGLVQPSLRIQVEPDSRPIPLLLMQCLSDRSPCRRAQIVAAMQDRGATQKQLVDRLQLRKPMLSQYLAGKPVSAKTAQATAANSLSPPPPPPLPPRPPSPLHRVALPIASTPLALATRAVLLARCMVMSSRHGFATRASQSQTWP